MAGTAAPEGPGLPDLEFVYVADPMCSWCWGFAPVVEQIEQRYDIPLTVRLGGLRPGPAAEALNPGFAAMLAEHWDHVEAASGQPFDRAPLGWEGWVYDTEPPSIATVTMRELDAKQARPFFARLQRAFYAEATDITDWDAYPQLLDGFAVDHDRFLELLRTDETKRTTWEDFGFARRLGITGFPTLLLREEGRHHVVTHGYQPFDRLEPALTAWLETRFGPAVEGLVCEIGEPC